VSEKKEIDFAKRGKGWSLENLKRKRGVDTYLERTASLGKKKRRGK